MRAAAAAALLVAVHAEDEEIVERATATVRDSGRRDPSAWVASRPAAAEIRAVTRACAAARNSGAMLHVVHMSSAGVLGAIGLARQAGTDVSVETCAHYLTFDETDVSSSGPLLKCAPPIRDAANRDALWDALLGGRIDLVASDHSPCPPADKEKGRDDIFAAWGGVSGVQSLLPAVFTEARRRSTGMDARKVAGFIAWRLAAKPADRFGLGARKGRIKAGADADIVLFDPDREWALEPAAVLTRSVLTPYAGRRFTGAVVRTLVRGRTIYPEADTGARGRFVAAERAA
jgi:allantoinase